MNAKYIALVLLTALGIDRALAEDQQDPTRPPAIFDAAPTAPIAAPGGLQSIIRRQGAKPAAVINGTYVELGGRVGDAQLERIGDDSVDLRTATGRETLQLTPGIRKQPAAKGNGALKWPGAEDKRRDRRELEEARP